MTNIELKYIVIGILDDFYEEMACKGNCYNNDIASKLYDKYFNELKKVFDEPLQHS